MLQYTYRFRNRVDEVLYVLERFMARKVAIMVSGGLFDNPVNGTIFV